MSQQIICDLCGKPIERPIIGETTYQVRLISRMGVYFNTEPVVEETDYDFCEDCMKKIENTIDELKANEKGNDDENPNS